MLPGRGTDRIELYTEPYAAMYSRRQGGSAGAVCQGGRGGACSWGWGSMPGMTLTSAILRGCTQNIPWLLEVSIGHALISDALYYGLENTIQMYLRELRRS